MQVGKLDNFRTTRAEYLYGGVERDQRLRPVAGIGCDAIFRRPQNGMASVHAVHGRTARTRITLVALPVAGIAEIGAARHLQHVTAQPRHVANLRACCQPQRVGQHRTGFAHIFVRRKLGHRHQRTDFKGLAVAVDPVERLAGHGTDVDDPIGTQYIKLHQIDKRSPARMITRIVRILLHGFGGRAYRYIFKWSHQLFPMFFAPCFTAATILG